MRSPISSWVNNFIGAILRYHNPKHPPLANTLLRGSYLRILEKLSTFQPFRVSCIILFLENIPIRAKYSISIISLFLIPSTNSQFISWMFHLTHFRFFLDLPIPPIPILYWLEDMYFLAIIPHIRSCNRYLPINPPFK